MAEDGKTPCVPCGGEGWYFDKSRMAWTDEPCPECQGTGRVTLWLPAE